MKPSALVMYLRGKSTFEVTDKLELRNLLEVIIDFRL